MINVRESPVVGFASGDQSSLHVAHVASPAPDDATIWLESCGILHQIRTLVYADTSNPTPTTTITSACPLLHHHHPLRTIALVHRV